MNYANLYTQIIHHRQTIPVTGYTEKHHIIPRSLGGSNNADNIVALTAREHFICHYLLAKMYEENTFEWHKMNHAFMKMKSKNASQDRYFNSRLYDALQRNRSKVMSDLQSGSNNSSYGTKWIYNEELRQSKKIPKEDEIPNGWHLGRRVKYYTEAEQPKRIWKGYKKNRSRRDTMSTLKKRRKSFSRYVKAEKRIVEKAEREKVAKFRLEQQLRYNENHARELLYLITSGEYRSIRHLAQSHHWDKSSVSLISYFKKYISEYNEIFLQRKTFGE